MTRTAVILLVVAGAIPRWIVGGQSLYRDELSTYWLAGHDLGGMLALLRDEVEVTPPLSFVASWLTTRPDDAAHLLRLPAFVAGLATIPLVYALGARVADRRTGLVAAALTAASPFAISYSGEARAYALLVAFAALAPLAALLALDTRRRRWWVVFGVAVAAVAYTHYTGIFVVVVLYAWLVVTQPAARRPATIACTAAAVAYLPWAVTGLPNDLRAPDTGIVASFVDFSPEGVTRAVGHWALGHPSTTLRLTALPGTVALVLVGAGLVVGAARRGQPSDRVVLVVALALAAPAGEVLASAIGPAQLTVNSLASSFPALAVAVAVIVSTRVVALALVLLGMTIGAVRTALPSAGRPDFRPAARLIDREATARDVVVDGSGAFFGTPAGRPTPLAAAIDTPAPVVDLARIDAAVALAGPRGRLFVSMLAPPSTAPDVDPVATLRAAGLPPAYRLLERTTVRSRISGTEALVLGQ